MAVHLFIGRDDGAWCSRDLPRAVREVRRSRHARSRHDGRGKIEDHARLIPFCMRSSAVLYSGAPRGTTYHFLLRAASWSVNFHTSSFVICIYIYTHTHGRTL